LARLNYLLVLAANVQVQPIGSASTKAQPLKEPADLPAA
jgi:hypothetical protein